MMERRIGAHCRRK